MVVDTILKGWREALQGKTHEVVRYVKLLQKAPPLQKSSRQFARTEKLCRFVLRGGSTSVQKEMVVAVPRS